MEGLSESVKDNYDIPVDILNVLANRFIYNAPKEEACDVIKLLYRVEKAYWHYMDNYCNDRSPYKVQYKIKEFALQLFQSVPFLHPYIRNLNQILVEFNEYKRKIPKYGAILISTNMDKVLLVQNYWGKCTWAFPKGKAEENENPLACAIREVYEETSFDISTLAESDLYVEVLYYDRYTRLYIVLNVPEDVVFVPRTKYEIKLCKWFDMAHLLSSKGDIIDKLNVGITRNTWMMKKKLKSFLFEHEQVKKVKKQKINRITTANVINDRKTMSNQNGFKTTANDINDRMTTSKQNGFISKLNLYDIIKIIFIFIFSIFLFVQLLSKKIK